MWTDRHLCNVPSVGGHMDCSISFILHAMCIESLHYACHSAHMQVFLYGECLEVNVELVGQRVFTFAIRVDSGQLSCGGLSYCFLPPAQYESAVSL